MNDEVTEFLDNLTHPFRNEIEVLRKIILKSNSNLSENIKWNAPNYCLDGDDRITMRIQSPKQIQIIFHRGAKVLEQPKDKLIKDDSELLTWKTNDRAVATFRNMAEITSSESNLSYIINAWLKASYQ